MYCKKCGTELNEGAAFCKKCGTPTGTSGDRKEDIKQPEDKKSKKKKRGGFKGVIFSIILLVFACVILKSLFPEIISPTKEDDYEPEVSDVKSEDTLYEFDEANVSLDEETGIEYVNNILIIFFTDDANEADVQSVVDSLKGKIVGRIPLFNQYQVEVGKKSFSELNNLCNELEKSDKVEYASADIALRIQTDSVEPDDPWPAKRFNGLKAGWEGLFQTIKWDEKNPNGANWWLEAINAPTAWAMIDKETVNSVSIGIIDEGFDLGHEDLRGRLILAKNSEATNNLEDHGTHVAGIIGAIPNNGKGIAGVVNRLLTKITVEDFKKTDKQEKDDGPWERVTDLYICESIKSLICDHHVKIVNMSLGAVDISWDYNDFLNYHGSLLSKCLLELREEEKDFIIVQAAGNGVNVNNVKPVKKISVDAKYNGFCCSITKENCCTSENVSFEDIYDRTIVVGAAQNNGNNEYMQRKTSNAGSRVDICAPGEGIFSTIAHNEYDYMSGTSMAAPIVTGVCALVWSIDPSLSGPEVKKIVCENTKYKVLDNPDPNHPLSDSYRMVNAELAVKAAIEGLRNKDIANDKTTPSTNSSQIIVFDDGPLLGSKHSVSNNDADAEPTEEMPMLSSNEVSDIDDSKLDFDDLNRTLLDNDVYKSGPEGVVLKLYEALQKGDYNTVVECFDPETGKAFKLLGKVDTFLSGYSLIGESLWMPLLLSEAEIKDVAIVDCYATEINRVPIWDKVLNHSHDEAYVTAETRIEYQGEEYIIVEKFHVKDYGTIFSDWRIEEDYYENNASELPDIFTN